MTNVRVKISSTVVLFLLLVVAVPAVAWSQAMGPWELGPKNFNEWRTSNWLLKQQQEDGSWDGWGIENADEKTSEVVIALAEILGNTHLAVKNGADFLKGFYFIPESDDRPQCRGLVRYVRKKPPEEEQTYIVARRLTALYLAGGVPVDEVLELGKRRRAGGGYAPRGHSVEPTVADTAAALYFLNHYNPALAETTAIHLASRQNLDGSFGPKHGIGDTGKSLLALAPSRNIPIVSNTILAGLKFLASGTRHPLDKLPHVGDYTWAALAVKVIAGEINEVVANEILHCKRSLNHMYASVMGQPVATALFLRLLKWDKPPLLNFETLRPIPVEKVEFKPIAEVAAASGEPSKSPTLVAGGKSPRRVFRRPPSSRIKYGRGAGMSHPSFTLDGLPDGLCTVQDVIPQIEVHYWSGTDLFLLLDGLPYKRGTPIQDEGEHTLELGDGTRAPEVVRFRIDRTTPVIEFSGVEKGGSAKTPFTPGISIADKNLDGKDVTLNGELYQPGTPIKKEGAYTLTVAAWDCAGNLEEKSVSFVVEAAR